MKNLKFIFISLFVILLITGCNSNQSQKPLSGEQVSTMEEPWKKNNQELTGKIVNDPKFHEENVFVFIADSGGMYLITSDSKYNKLCNEKQKAIVKGDLEHKYGMYRYNDTIKIEKLECHDN